MPGFQDIIGYDNIKTHLKNSIERNKVSHAYIISGEKGSGKNSLADAFSMALQCEKKGSEPCMECPSCKQALGRNQPDIIRVSHKNPGSIGVEEIREQVNGDIAIRPYSGPWKIYIIDEAEKMTPAAQNALLKTLEEPPPYAVLLLLATNADLFLPTILSRCIRLDLKPLDNALVMGYLREKLGITGEKLQICAAFAQGNLGKAISLALAEDFDNLKFEALGLIRRLPAMETFELIETLKNISDFRLGVNDYLDLFQAWFRDVLLFKATNDLNNLVFSGETNSIIDQANRCSYEGIETIMASIENTRARLRANVNFDLAIELMLLTIKENLQ